MVVAEALDFPGAVTEGFDPADARVMIASAMEDLARCLPGEGEPLPTPNPDACADADLVELVTADRPCWSSASLKRHELIGHLKAEGCLLDSRQSPGSKDLRSTWHSVDSLIQARSSFPSRVARDPGTPAGIDLLNSFHTLVCAPLSVLPCS